ncbi:hypothetical protein [Natronomonas sp. EA1]|uniref:hypothetical protein n=1 Tax=Natronomonas sp. EA1 TaxID=3421655 RepID=UPI003EB7A582
MTDLLAGSRVAGAMERVTETLTAWSRGSWLYGWLTAEPDPEVIVIDLRETYTVGPVIALIDRVAGWVGPRWHGSGPERLWTRLKGGIERASEGSLVVELLEKVLVPPETYEQDR